MTFFKDLLLATRTLRRSPALVAVSTLSLTLGIGVNTFVFSIFDSFLLQKPTADRADRLVGIEPGNGNLLSFPNYRDLRESATLRDVAAYRTVGLVLRSGDQISKVDGMAVTGNFFELLGVHAAVGRAFSSNDVDTARNPDVVVLTYGFWRQHFNEAPGALGRSLDLNGHAFAVLGVLPREYRALTGALGPEVYLPLSELVAPDVNRRDARQLRVLGRLEQSVDREQVRARVGAVFEELERRHPDVNKDLGRSVLVLPVSGLASLGSRGTPPEFMAFLSFPFVVVALLLLIACANVASLLLFRGLARRKEIAIRVSLGATRAQIVQTLLAESVVLSAVATAAALGLTWWLIPILRVVRLPGMPSSASLNVTPHFSLFVFGVIIAAATAVCSGLAPALRASRVDAVVGMRDESGLVRGRRTFQNGLVIGQVAVSIVLLVISFLFLGSLLHMARAEPGFDLHHVLTATIDLGVQRGTTEQNSLLADRAIERLERSPGVEAVSATNMVPLGGDSASESFLVEGRPAWKGPDTFLQNVSPGYFRTMGIRLLRGRDFMAADRLDSAFPVVVNETFARTYFAGASAVGKRVRMHDKEPFHEIVGVVIDSKYQLFAEQPHPLLYRPYQGGNPVRLLVRMSRPPGSALALVKRAISDLDHTLLVETRTLEAATRLEYTIRRGAASLLGGMGALGVLLAMIGLYGVTAQSVQHRIKEIGVRMALGATPSAVVSMILSDGLRLVGVGVVVGAAISLASTRALAFMLAGVKATDPWILGTAAALLMLAGTLASYLPARRASRVEPLAALHHE